MLSILKRFLWPLTELESKEELEGKKSLADPESFFTNLSLGPMATTVSLMAKNEREELSRLSYRSALFDLFEDGDDW